MDKLKAVAEKTGLKQFVVKTPENSTESILQQTALNYMKAAGYAGDVRRSVAAAQ